MLGGDYDDFDDDFPEGIDGEGYCLIDYVDDVVGYLRTARE
jgi:hypothetical protein